MKSFDEVINDAKTASCQLTDVISESLGNSHLYAMIVKDIVVEMIDIDVQINSLLQKLDEVTSNKDPVLSPMFNGNSAMKELNFIKEALLTLINKKDRAMSRYEMIKNYALSF